MLRSEDIPQADRLDHVRVVLQAIHQGASTSLQIQEKTGISSRHVSYMRHSARILGWMGEEEITPTGLALLATSPGSTEERWQFELAVRQCPVLKQLAPELLGAEAPATDLLTSRIQKASQLAQATSQRRAQTLLSWRSQVWPLMAPPELQEPRKAPKKTKDPKAEPAQVPEPPVVRSEPVAPKVKPPKAARGRRKAIFKFKNALPPARPVPKAEPVNIAEPSRAPIVSGLMLRRLQLENFGVARSFSLEVSPVTVLAGGHGNGKSTLVDSLRLVSDALRLGLLQATSSWGKLGGEPERFGIALTVELPTGTLWRMLRYELELMQPSTLLWEALWLCPTDPGPTPLRTEVAPPGWRRILKTTGQLADFQAEDGRWGVTFNVGSDRLGLDALPTDSPRFPLAKRLRAWLRGGLCVLTARSLGEPGRPESASLPGLVRRLEEQGRLEGLMPKLRERLPWLGGLRTVEEQNGRVLMIKEDGRERAARRMSEGSLKLLALSLLPHAASADELWVVDTLEDQISPPLLTEIGPDLLRRPGGAQLLVTTRSPSVSSAVKPSQVRWLRRDKGILLVAESP